MSEDAREAPFVLFDVMDTLAHDPYRDVLPAFFGLSLEELMTQKHPTAFLEFERGERDEASFLRDFFADARPFDHAAFVARMFAAYRWLDGMEPLVAKLAAAGVPLHTASNYPTWYLEVERRLGVSRYLRWTGVSTLLGVRKPDAAYWDALLARLGTTPERCVLVDDQPRNCASAAAYGMKAIRFRSAEQLEGALREAHPALDAVLSGTRSGA